MSKKRGDYENLKPFKKGNPGRPKGSPNKFTQLKRDFLAAYETIGGVEELADWAKQQRNRALFYKMIAQMLPKHVTVTAEDLAIRLAERIQDRDPEMYEKLVGYIQEMEQEE